MADVRLGIVVDWGVKIAAVITKAGGILPFLRCTLSLSTLVLGNNTT